jgi:tetratricopeptide (TPR) repeat protein
MTAKKNGTAPTAELVEKLIEEGRWVDARRAIDALLRDRPDDHWLLTRLSTTYYEMGDYEKALKLADRALKIAPGCPLALWDRASALDMLGREEEALRVYKMLLSRGQLAIAEDECGEGEEWAASLMADCLYRAGCILKDLGRKFEAAKHYRAYLHMLDLGVRSIYDREEAAAKLRALIPKKDRRVELNEVLNAVEK